MSSMFGIKNDNPARIKQHCNIVAAHEWYFDGLTITTKAANQRDEPAKNA